MNRWYTEIVPTNKYSYRINQVAFLFYSPLSFFVSKGSHYLLLFHFFHSFSSSFSSVFGLEWYQTPSLSPWVCLSYDLVESFTPIFFNYCDILAEMTWPKLSSRPSPPSAIIYSHIFFATGNQLSPQIPRKEMVFVDLGKTNEVPIWWQLSIKNVLDDCWKMQYLY